jgi:hypothetical protein
MVRVTSIPALLTALANNSVDEIVVADGRYRVSGASAQRSDSLWVNSRFAARTRPIVVRAETTGGVTFDGGGATYFIGLAFNGGAHDQTWQGFRFANGAPTQTGVITFGWSGGTSMGAGPHHITLRDITIERTITSTYAGSGDHSVYFSQSVGGAHDILIDGLTVDGAGGVNTALTFYHSAPGEPNAWNVTVRRLNVTGTRQAIEIWDETVRNLVIEDSSISGALSYAVRYEHGEVTLRRVTSANSGQAGFYSSQGANPPGVTFIDCTLR